MARRKKRKTITTRETPYTRKKEVKYREVVYLGTADISTVRGAVTEKVYTFRKNEARMPIATRVDEKDYLGIVALRGKGCARRNPEILYMSKVEWDLELEEAKRINR